MPTLPSFTPPQPRCADEPRIEEPRYRTEHASGSGYALSDAPFHGQTGTSLGTASPWVIGAVSRHFVRAGAEPIYVGGRAYNTTANGRSRPVVIQPGQCALLTRTAEGSPSSFSKWLVEFPEESTHGMAGTLSAT